METPSELSIVESVFMNALKEAEFLAEGSTKRIMGASKAHQKALWDSIVRWDATTYAAALAGIWASSNAESPDDPGLRSLSLSPSLSRRSYCVRMILTERRQSGERIISKVIQEPLAPDAFTTIGDVLRAWAPAGGWMSSEEEAEAGERDGVRDSDGNRNDDVDARVLVHGVPIPLSTPLDWASSHLRHPDNFLYVTVAL